MVRPMCGCSAAAQASGCSIPPDPTRCKPMTALPVQRLFVLTLGLLLALALLPAGPGAAVSISHSQAQPQEPPAGEVTAGAQRELARRLHRVAEERDPRSPPKCGSAAARVDASRDADRVRPRARRRRRDRLAAPRRARPAARRRRSAPRRAARHRPPQPAGRCGPVRIHPAPLFGISHRRRPARPRRTPAPLPPFERPLRRAAIPPRLLRRPARPGNPGPRTLRPLAHRSPAAR